MIQSLAFVAYPVSVIARSRHFYEEILGLKLTHQALGDWFEYDLGDTSFAITTTDKDHPVPIRGAVVAFEVSDLDAEVDRLRKLGVMFHGDITETPVCRFAIALDPDGSEVILHRRKVVE
jgi:predicted enzyme related to lactoylglutathione lyase